VERAVYASDYKRRAHYNLAIDMRNADAEPPAGNK